MPPQLQHRGVLGAVWSHFHGPIQACEQTRILAFAGSFSPAPPRRIAFHTAQEAVQWRLERLRTIQTRNYFWE